MKTVFSDPVGWSEKAAKTRSRVAAAICIHVAFVGSGIGIFAWAVQDRIDAILLVMGGALHFLLAGVIFPAAYLYAMYRLLCVVRGSEPVRVGAAGEEHDE